MTDNLRGIFDNLTPDMFITETSAIDESEGVYRGSVAFNASVDERLRGIRAAFATSYGQVNPLAVLTNATTQRVFTPQQDENLGQFLERLKREARSMGAHWFFLAKKNVVAVVWEELEDTDERHDVTSKASELMAKAAGVEPEVGILWYAESREGNERVHRHGALRIEGNKLGEATEGDGQQTHGVFSLILDAVIR